jgi:hypothetical protein
VNVLVRYHRRSGAVPGAARLRPYTDRQPVEFVPDASECEVERLDLKPLDQPETQKAQTQNPEPKTQNWPAAVAVSSQMHSEVRIS